jgi:transposase
MYVARAKWSSKNGKKTYESIWLRESYRENGKVKTRNIANLKNCSEEEITAIELALKHKKNLADLGSIEDVDLKEGVSVGAVWAVYQMAKKLGIEKALGSDFQGQLALWQVLARVLDQGSRLSAVRLAQSQAADSVLRFERGFCEDDLYKNLTWLADRQAKIEKKLFMIRRGANKPGLFLYDVTSSYLEGEHNDLGDWGYNRDKKRGKQQIVIGLLCDEEGEPVSTEVFKGNTGDLSTFESQVKKAVDRFGCERVTFVGDRGMIKSGQVENLSKVGFNYITAITKPQIRSLIKKGVFQLGLFDEDLCEVEQEGLRYILRKNPIRADEMAQSRSSRLTALKDLADKQNKYLAEHPKADQHKAWEKVSEKRSRLFLGAFVSVTAKDRHIHIEVDEEYMAKIAELDGCYALKTDLPVKTASAKTVHERYKDLSMVETAFRTMKTSHLKVRPVFVRNAERTRAHVLVVMLSYLIVRELKKAWADFDLTVEEGLDLLKNLCAVEFQVKDGASCFRIPEPRELSKGLLDAINVRLPTALPQNRVNVGTRRKLTKSRISV